MIAARSGKSPLARVLLLCVLACALFAPSVACDTKKGVASIPAPIIFDDDGSPSRGNSSLILVVMDDPPF